MSFGFHFNGIYSVDKGLIVTDVKRSLLPSQTAKTVSIPQRPGGYYFWSDTGIGQIQVDVTYSGSDIENAREITRDLAAWLRPNGTAELVFDDEPDKTYDAVLDGSTDLTQVIEIQQGTLTFICPDPFAYTQAQTSQLTEESTVENPGTENAFPVFDITLSKATTFLTIVSPDEFLLIGEPNAVNQVPVSTNERIIYDECTDTSVWKAGSVTDYGGVIQGSYATDGNTFYVSSYGSASNGWAGPALVRSVANPFHDFDLHVLVNWDTTNDKDAMARIEIYGLDVNGAVLCKMVIGDYWSSSKMAETIVRIGSKTASNAYKIMDTYGKKKGDLNKFYGKLEIQRKGQKWTATTAVRKSEGVYINAITKTWYDANKEWDNNIAQVEIHTARYGSHKSPAKCTIDHVFLYQLSDLTDDTQIANIGDSGDVVRIDCGKAAAYLNGDPRMDLVDPSCDLPGFSLAPGETELEIEPWDAISSVQMTLSSRYV